MSPVVAAPHRRRGVVRALGSGLGLLAALVGFPVLLWALAGWPLPHAVPSWSEMSSALDVGYFPDRLWIGAAAVVGWLAWAQLAAGVVVELVALSRRCETPRVRLVVGPARHLARRLVGSAAMVGALVVPRVAMAHPAPPPPSALVVPRPAPAAAAPEQAPVYVVQTWEAERDCLWTIAERHLGDGMRWRDIWELNRGRPQPDGATLDDAQLIRPGWILVMPPDAVGLPTSPAVVVPPPAPVPPTVPPSTPVPATNGPTTLPNAAGTGAVGPSTTTPPAAQAPPPPTTEQAPQVAARQSADPAPPIRLGRGAIRVAQALALGLPVFAAGGLVRHLNRRRRAQTARCRPGRDIVRPDPACEPLERKARAIAVDQAAEWVDATVRVLGARLRQAGLPAPLITCVRAGQMGLEVLLAEACLAAPPGFDAVDDGFVWRLGTGTELAELAADAVGMGAATPALVSIGYSPEGPLLVDLEGIGVLSVEGDPARVAAFLAGVAVELASASWAEAIELHLVGPEPGLGAVEDVSVGEDPAALAGEMVELAQFNVAELGVGTTTLAARLAEPAEGWYPSVVVVGGTSTPPELARLAEQAKPGCGVVLVAPGPLPGARWRLVVVEDGCARLEPLGLVVRASAAPAIDTDIGHLDDQAMVAAAGLLSAASHDDDVAPLVEITTPPQRGSALRRRTYDVWVKVLGPVEVTGWAKAVGHRSKHEEVLSYLATHDDPVPGEVVRAAVWTTKEMEAESFCQAMSRLRSHLGRGHLPNAVRGCYCLAPSVGCDWCWFRELSTAASARSTTPPDAMALWSEALELVRGQPFGGGLVETGSFGWAYSEGLVYDMQRGITKAADALAGLALSAGDPTTAQWAVRQGHLATPGQLTLFDWEMHAARHRLDAEGLKLAFRSRRTAQQVIDPSEDVPPETVVLYKRLLAEINEITGATAGTTTRT